MEAPSRVDGPARIACHRCALTLWNLSVQTSFVAVMATGMVLVIVSRNIDLSVGSVVAVTGMAMALLQARVIPTTLDLGFGQPFTWIVTVLFGLGFGGAIGALSGSRMRQICESLEVASDCG